MIAITETLKSGSLSLRQFVGTNFDAGDKLCNDPTGVRLAYIHWAAITTKEGVPIYSVNAPIGYKEGRLLSAFRLSF